MSSINYAAKSRGSDLRIVVNHLTRMKNGRICVAGIDLDTRKHVRPILTDGLWKEMLERNGGPFEMANVLELGATQPYPVNPKVEDHYFDLANVRKIRTEDSAEFWRLLENTSADEWTTIFGSKMVLSRSGNKAYLAEGTGQASLGCLRPAAKPSVHLITQGSKPTLRIHVKAKFAGAELTFELSLTDIRFYKADHSTPDERVINQVKELLDRDSVILGVGVGCAMISWYYPPAHWLQVNAVHLSSNPTWRLG